MQMNHRKSQSHAPRRKIGLTLGVASLFLLMGTTACNAATEKSTFDAATKQFAPCPESPNCVSTQAPESDEEHAIASFTYSGTATAAHEQLLAIIDEMPRTKMITDQAIDGGYYLHVEFRSRIFRFVDDVEFFIHDTGDTIDFRSASRLGYSDLGVNRKRMEEIRERFQAG